MLVGWLAATWLRKFSLTLQKEPTQFHFGGSFYLRWLLSSRSAVLASFVWVLTSLQKVIKYICCHSLIFGLPWEYLLFDSHLLGDFFWLGYRGRGVEAMEMSLVGKKTFPKLTQQNFCNKPFTLVSQLWLGSSLYFQIQIFLGRSDGFFHYSTMVVCGGNRNSRWLFKP